MLLGVEGGTFISVLQFGPTRLLQFCDMQLQLGVQQVRLQDGIYLL